MEYVPIILAVLALIVAGFTFYKVSGLVYRIHTLEKKNRELEAGLRSMENQIRRTGKNPQQDTRQQENNRQGRGNQQQATAQPQQQRTQQQPQEPRQKQQGQQPGRGQQPQEPRVQGQPQQQRNPQEPKVRQEGQPQQQQRPPREPREPRENRPPQEPRQKQPQAQPQADGSTPNPRAQQQPQRRNDNRRREQVSAADPEQASLVQPVVSPTLGKEIVGDDLLNELTQQAAPQPEAQQPEAPVSRTRYAIIPEDGVIKTHQLQHRPDSDSYLEIDTPSEGSTNTRYRFNLSGNQAFVISQGMDRLENAFSFEKPSNRMVNHIIHQGDGVLARTSSGWKIQEKAKIDFR